jgi:lipid II:glycine glycyltransferase (peptidoglycan interpeptide bridge formation enzyme)
MIALSNTVFQIDISDERWTAFVESMPQANIFHNPAWVNLLAECYGYRPFVIALIDEGDRICAGLPILDVRSHLTGRRWVSLPFTDYCPPLYRDRRALENLTQGLVGLFQEKHNPRFEVRWELPACPPIQSYSPYVRHTLNLNRDIESISKFFHRTQRQNIKTAEKNGVQIELGKDLDHLRMFYRLHCLTRRRQGVPVQPWRFFELLLIRIIEKGYGFILLAYKADQCLAAGLFLYWQQSLIYKYAASNESDQNLRPNHLLTWTAIRWGSEHGLKVLDFGRTDVENEGLRTFKNRWGADEIPLSYSILSAKPPQLSSGRRGALMHRIIQNSPLWVCRSAGELLYRHYG